MVNFGDRPDWRKAAYIILHLLFKSETVGYRNPRIDKVEALFGREGAFFAKDRILVMQQYCINGTIRYKIRPELEELFNN